MFCSTIIPTVNRPTLTRAVCSVLEQAFAHDDFEVIVVNDSGRPLEFMEWQRDPRVQVLQTYGRERSVARNTGAAVAKGKYLHFLDDDDYMLPGAFEQIWQLARRSQALLLYGGYRMVDNDGITLEECRPDEEGNCFVRFVTGEWLPLQVSFIEATSFNKVGGFAPLESLLGGVEDIDLPRKLSNLGDIARTPELIATIRMGRVSSTTNWSNLSEQMRMSREKTLELTGAFERLWDSVTARNQARSYWYGRMTWIYLSSIHWNLKRKRPLTAMSRALYSAASVMVAGPHLFTRAYWQGATKPHQAKGWLSSTSQDYLSG